MSSGQSSWLGTAGGFLKGVGEGAVDGVTGMAQGVGTLAHGAYSLATSADARQQAVNTVIQDAKAVGQFAQTAVTDPDKAAGQVSDAVSGAWDQVSTAYQQAAAQGHGGEFLGKLVGQGVVLAGTALIPGDAEAEAAGLAGNAGRVAELASNLGKAGEVAGDAGKVADVGKAVDATASTGTTATDAGKTAQGMGDAGQTTQVPRGARGPSSGRTFDLDKAGGPIVPKSLDDVRITHKAWIRSKPISAASSSNSDRTRSTMP